MRDRARRAAQTVERRQSLLQQRHNRLATESAEEREARLQQMSSRQRERLATESAEEREARLQQMRERLACVYTVAEISTYRRCAPLLTIWTLAPYHSSCRLACKQLYHDWYEVLIAYCVNDICLLVGFDSG